MSKKEYSFLLLKCSLFLVCCTAFSQTERYKSDFAYDNPLSGTLKASMTASGADILFQSPDRKLYSINKKEGKINWMTDVGAVPNTVPYLYQNTFFYTSTNNGINSTAQYNLETGEKIKELPWESVNTPPFFLNDVMYCTAFADGGKLIAYSLTEKKIIWQQNIGLGSEVNPVYLKDKIIVNAEDYKWFEIDYSGKLLKSKSTVYSYLDSSAFFIRKYKFLTHDHKEITEHFLKRHKLLSFDYQVKTNSNHTFILTDKQFLIAGHNKKKIVQLNLEKEFPAENFDQDSPLLIFTVHPQSVWFSFQNQLLHYDFKNKKLLRKVNLTKWNPYQIILENTTIWLLSENDGQLYGLDFEPDQQTADMIEARANYYKCREPDPQMIKAAKAKLEARNTNNTK